MADIRLYNIITAFLLMMVMGCGGEVRSSNVIGTSPDTTPPTVSSTSPAMEQPALP